MKLEQNVGTLDRVARLITGSGLVAAGYFLKSAGLVGIVIVWFGILTFIEGMLGYCFLYGLFGWSTKRRRNRAVGN